MAFTTDGLNVGERRVGFYSRRGNRTSCRGGRWTGRNSSCTATTRSAGKRRCSIKGGGAFTPDLRGRSSTRTSWQVSLKRRRAISAWSLCTTNTNKRTLEGHLKTFDQERWKHSSLSSEPLMCLYTRKNDEIIQVTRSFGSGLHRDAGSVFPAGHRHPTLSIRVVSIKGTHLHTRWPCCEQSAGRRLWTPQSSCTSPPSDSAVQKRDVDTDRHLSDPQVIRLFFFGRWRFILIFSGGGKKKCWWQIKF